LELHQSSGDSSDFNFDLQLIDPNVIIAYGSDWYYYAKGQMPGLKPLGETGITEEKNIIPDKIQLAQNYPNPFNPITLIRFALNESGPVRLSVYDVAGRRIMDLVDLKLPAGWHEYRFDGSKMASGIYYYNLVTSKGSLTRKMVLIK
jgi:hypothetical protein